MAAEAAGSKAGLSGAAAEETVSAMAGMILSYKKSGDNFFWLVLTQNLNNVLRTNPQSRENWKYETIKLKASIQRTVEGTLSASSGTSHTIEEETTVQTRATRKQLYQETSKWALDMSGTVEASMSWGASFPIKIVKVESSSSIDFSLIVEGGIASSKTRKTEYAEENVSTVRSKVTQIFVSNAKGGEDKVVYREVGKLGETVFRDLSLDTTVAKSKEQGWAMEVQDVTMTVAVDRQWYRIKNGNGQYLNAGGGFTNLLVTKGPNNSYAQQWALDQGHLISKSDVDVYCGLDLNSVNEGNCKITNVGQLDTGFVRSSGTQLKRGAYCMTYVDMGIFGNVVNTEECNGSNLQQWTFIKAVSFVHGLHCMFSHSFVRLFLSNMLNIIPALRVITIPAFSAMTNSPARTASTGSLMAIATAADILPTWVTTAVILVNYAEHVSIICGLHFCSYRLV